VTSDQSLDSVLYSVVCCTVYCTVLYSVLYSVLHCTVLYCAVYSGRGYQQRWSDFSGAACAQMRGRRGSTDDMAAVCESRAHDLKRVQGAIPHCTGSFCSLARFAHQVPGKVSGVNTSVCLQHGARLMAVYCCWQHATVGTVLLPVRYCCHAGRLLEECCWQAGSSSAVLWLFTGRLAGC
jgi:hypothetical protein